MSDGSKTELLKNFVKKGEVPPKPFVLPMICTVAAKAEGIAPEQFLLSATKLSNTLKRVYQYYRYDGILAYCCNHVESEVLGCNVERQCFPTKVTVHGDTSPLDDITPLEEVPYAMLARDVVQRLRITVRDQQVLSVALSGMMKLAKLCFGQTSDAALESASTALLKLGQFFCQEGANIVFFIEDSPGPDGAYPEEWWRNFRQVAKVLMYHEALPAVLLGVENAEAANSLLFRAEDFLPCFICDDSGSFVQIMDELLAGKAFGIGFGLDILLSDNLTQLKDAISRHKDRIVLFTSSEEIPYDRFQPDLLQKVSGALDEISNS